MSYNVSRLTLFAIISGIESDLRDFIVDFLSAFQPEDVCGSELYAKCISRLESPLDDEANRLEQIIYGADFPDLFQILNANSQNINISLSKYFRKVTPDFEKLVKIRNRVAHNRPLDYEDFPLTFDIAEKLSEAKEVDWKNIKEVFKRLRREPGFVFGVKIPSPHSDTGYNERHNLPLPDFDETGYLGRKKEIADIKKLIFGAFPVISIVAEGGVGKTALALKVAYEILDSEDNPFESIIWTSSKTTLLTIQNIENIKNAITSSIGMFSNVAHELSGIDNLSVDESIKEILSYMKHYKILVILDNLETIMDERIKGFIGDLPIGSKMLITSRIGIGPFEHPYKLDRMEVNDAVQLLRALSKNRRVRVLSNLPNDKLKEFCEKMYRNPLYMKWFVSAVQSGKRPEEIFAHNEMFLDYCLSNVYDYLSEDAQRILAVMLSIPEKLSQSELLFFSDLEISQLQNALNSILTTNMVMMESIASGSSFETSYYLTDLSKAYLSKHHPVKESLHQKFIKRKRQITATIEDINIENKDPYSFYHIYLRSNSDQIIAKYLYDALHLAKRVDSFDDIDELIKKAKSLSPEYFEVHRVEAIIRAIQKNYSAANEAYLAAIELMPNYAPLRAWYGAFLLRAMEDSSGAIREYDEALKIDGAAVYTLLDKARAKMYLSEFDEAKMICSSLLKRTDLTDIEKRKLYDLNLQCYLRNAKRFDEKRSSVETILPELELLKYAYLQYDPSYIDDKIRVTLAKSFPIIEHCLKLCKCGVVKNNAVKKICQDLYDWICTAIAPEVAYNDGNIVKNIEELKRRYDENKLISEDKHFKHGFEEIQIGSDIEVKVKSFESYGIFVNYNGFDGLLHNSEVSWGNILSLDKLFLHNETLKVKVIKISEDFSKYWVSIKQMTLDLWEDIDKYHALNSIEKVQIVKVLGSQVIVKTNDNLYGFILISEFTSKGYVDISLKRGEFVDAVVSKIFNDSKKIQFSLVHNHPQNYNI